MGEDQSDSGNRTYSMTAKRMISGLVLKYLKGERLVIRRHYFACCPRSSEVPLTRPLREIELKRAEGSDGQRSCRAVGISDATYFDWRRCFGGMALSQLSEQSSLERANAWPKKIVAEP